jgi:hypothetical protein
MASMRWPQIIDGSTPFQHEWFNDVTKVIQALEARIWQLESQLSAMQVECSCGNTALTGDYLCGHCRESFEASQP